MGCRVETEGYTIELVPTEMSVYRSDATLDFGIRLACGLGFVIH